MKLGKALPRLDPRTLKAARYMGALPPPPAATDWTPKAGPLGMMLNDRLGDCTCAAAGHLIQLWTGNARGTPIIVPDSAVEAAYTQVGGYNPADPETDRGAVELDVLRSWKAGLFAGHPITAFASVNPQNSQEVRQAVALLGGLYIGLALPLTAQGQQVWDYDAGVAGSQENSWGGHAVPVVGYNATGPLCITWGAVKQMTWRFFAVYCDEAYAVLSADWIEANNLAPSGFDIATLQTDLAQL